MRSGMQRRVFTTKAQRIPGSLKQSVRPWCLCGELRKRFVVGSWLLVCLFTLVGCGVNMREGGRLKPYENSAFFPNNGTSLGPVPSTVRSEEHTSELQSRQYLV